MFSTTTSAPGVYVLEETPSARPIAGAGTSTAGFIGVYADLAQTAFMPKKADGSSYTQVAKGQPTLVTSWNEFEQKFGGFTALKNAEAAGSLDDALLPSQYLCHGVYGFFNNGGTRCWVIRVADVADMDQATIDKFSAIEEIAIVAAPNKHPKNNVNTSLYAALYAHCKNMQNRVAIMDSTYYDLDNPPTNFQAADLGRPAAESDGYGAFYTPWIEVANPLATVKGSTQPSTIFVPPSGHIAGIYALNDAQRGVFKAPANYVITGALNVSYPISKNEQAGVNSSGVNCIRSFGGTIKVWGARTLASDLEDGGDVEWQYVSTRRFVNYLRQSIEQGTQWVVFEPNSTQLWAQIRRNISAFLTDVWQVGGLFGQKPEEAFFVRCDESTNPPELRELGQVVAEIGVAIVYPAEFVVFQIQQWTAPGK